MSVTKKKTLDKQVSTKKNSPPPEKKEKAREKH
jgi:hypothetical protein